MESISILNQTMDLAECRDRWTWNEAYDCWQLEDVLYTDRATVPKFQRLSVFAPKDCLTADGQVTALGRQTPVVFENNSAGYMQMPHTWLGGPRCYAEQYLKHGLVYVTCGCRGRESRDEEGRLVGKAPASLVDLKTALRFLRHNRESLPGDWEKVISVGWSAGGAMSALLAVTGDNENYLPYLIENGAFLEESDAVFAAQIYCPIVDLEHADLAYEWMFRADKTCEDSPAGPAETMTPFKEALSRQLANQYVDYFNGLGLRHPETGETLTLRADGRGGSGYDFLMGLLEASAADFLRRLERGELPLSCSAADYLAGHYTTFAPAPTPPPKGDGPAPSLGDLVSRPPKGAPFHDVAPAMMEVPGADKKSWLSWDGETAHITSLDDYVLRHRRRMKPCTAFDKLTMDSGENQAFGSMEDDYLHFSPAVLEALEAIKADFPADYARYAPAFEKTRGDEALARRVYLTNPLNFIGTGEKSRQAKHYRIRVGASDADTSLSVSMTLALKLQNVRLGTVDYALVWDQPHSEADYPGEVLKWIDGICGQID